MKIKNITYPTTLDKIEDVCNDNIDVFVELEDDEIEGFSYVVTVGTPQYYYTCMNYEKKDYISARLPDILVKKLDDVTIREAIEHYSVGNAYWLKLNYLSGIEDGIFDSRNIDELTDKL